MDLQLPYLLFLGDAADALAAKTAQGVATWRPEACIAQLRLEGCKADLGLPDMTLEQAWAAGARTLVIGVVNSGGMLAQHWIPILEQALAIGFDIANGLHDRLADLTSLADAAAKQGRRLFDVRHPDRSFEVGTGRKRSGKRLLTVGTDCSVGKMYTTLALTRELTARGRKATFRATGQTGILIAGRGVSIDAVVSDFVSGAVEFLTPDNDADHWDLIEGQGSLHHPSFASVSLGLLHGAQPDALVVCHEPTRSTMRGLDAWKPPSLEATIEANLAMARLTNPSVRLVGIAINSSALSEAEATHFLTETSAQFGVPTVDPLRQGAGAIVDRMEI